MATRQFGILTDRAASPIRIWASSAQAGLCTKFLLEMGQIGSAEPPPPLGPSSDLPAGPVTASSIAVEGLITGSATAHQPVAQSRPATAGKVATGLGARLQRASIVLHLPNRGGPVSAIPGPSWRAVGVTHLLQFSTPPLQRGAKRERRLGNAGFKRRRVRPERGGETAGVDMVGPVPLEAHLDQFAQERRKHRARAQHPGRQAADANSRRASRPRWRGCHAWCASTRRAPPRPCPTRRRPVDRISANLSYRQLPMHLLAKKEYAWMMPTSGPAPPGVSSTTNIYSRRVVAVRPVYAISLRRLY